MNTTHPYLHPFEKEQQQRINDQRAAALERVMIDQAEQLIEKDKTISGQIILILMLVFICLVSISRLVELHDLNTELNQKIAEQANEQ